MNVLVRRLSHVNHRQSFLETTNHNFFVDLVTLSTGSFEKIVCTNDTAGTESIRLLVTTDDCVYLSPTGATTTLKEYMGKCSEGTKISPHEELPHRSVLYYYTAIFIVNLCYSNSNLGQLL